MEIKKRQKIKVNINYDVIYIIIDILFKDKYKQVSIWNLDKKISKKNKKFKRNKCIKKIMNVKIK